MTKGRTPPPKNIVTLIYGGDNFVYVYRNDTLIAEGDCGFDLVDVLEGLGVHVLTLEGASFYDPAADSWPCTLQAALKLPQIVYHETGSFSKNPNETLASYNKKRVQQGRFLSKREYRAALDKPIRWARSMLAKPEALILNTWAREIESDYLIEIGIIRMDGRAAFASYVNPMTYIPLPVAEGLPPLTHAMLTEAPTFAEIEPQLIRLLRGRTVITYGLSIDRAALQNDLQRLAQVRRLAQVHQPDMKGDDHRRFAITWCEQIDWQCALMQCAGFSNEYTYGDDYQGQSEYGDHPTIHTCRATLSLVRQIAALKLTTET